MQEKRKKSARKVQKSAKKVLLKSANKNPQMQKPLCKTPLQNPFAKPLCKTPQPPTC